MVLEYAQKTFAQNPKITQSCRFLYTSTMEHMGYELYRCENKHYYL